MDSFPVTMTLGVGKSACYTHTNQIFKRVPMFSHFPVPALHSPSICFTFPLTCFLSNVFFIYVTSHPQMWQNINLIDASNSAYSEWGWITNSKRLLQKLSPQNVPSFSPWRELGAPLREVMSSTRQEVGTPGQKPSEFGQKSGTRN